MGPEVIVPLGFFASVVAVVLVPALDQSAWAGRWRRKRSGPQIPAEMSARLERMEQSIDAIAVEIERISEGQRFTTKLLAEVRDTPVLGLPAARPGTSGYLSVAIVLIVDDEPNIRRMVGALLSAEGHEIKEAANGAQGLAKAAQDDPDVVLLDLMMPGELDGMATLSQLANCASRDRCHHDERTRKPRRRGECDETWRGEFSREAAHSRRSALRDRLCARAATVAPRCARIARRARTRW